MGIEYGMHIALCFFFWEVGVGYIYIECPANYVLFFF